MKRHLKQNKTSLFTTLLLAITLVVGLYIRAHNTEEKKNAAQIQYGSAWNMEQQDDDSAFLGQ